MSLISEFRRRNVFRAAAAYIAVSWILMQLAEITFPAFGLGDRAILVLITVLAIGLIPAVTLSWIFELTPEGIKRESDIDRSGELMRRTNRILDRSIIALLAISVTYLAVDKFLLDPVRDEARLEAARQEGRLDALETTFGNKSIVVLPFSNRSDDPNQDYFSDGLSEQLQELLSRFPELRVISRTSAFSFKDKNVDMREIVEQLDVTHVLEGSVRWARDRLRITATLIDASQDMTLWTQTFDRPIDDIFSIQDQIATIVVQQLKVPLLGSAPTVEQTDPEAFVLYLQARQLSSDATAEAYEQANALLQRALAIDPDYATAWNALAVNSFKQFSRGLRVNEEGYAPARIAAQKALDADPNFAPALATLGLVAMEEANDFPAAAAYFERALRLAPYDLETIRHVVIFLQGLGRLDDAIALGEHAVSRDPVNASHVANLGNSYRWSGRSEEAIVAYQKALRLSPGIGAAHTFIGIALLDTDRPGDAIESIRLEPFEPYRLIGLALAHHALGETIAADAVLKELIEKYAQDWSYNIAYIHAYRNDIEGAFHWLDEAIRYADPGLSLIVAEPLFSNLHHDARWAAALRDLGKSPEQLEAIRFSYAPP
jgi:TolB-like protein/Flp pilus assembly protein TadD